MNVRRTASRLTRGRPWALPALLLLTVPLVANIGGASIPDTTGVIHGCYDDDGVLRVIDTDEITGTCKALETSLSWNEAGVAGADGVSRALSVRRAVGPDNAPTGPSYTNVVTQNVPTGFYVFLAKAAISSAPNQGSDCELTYDTGGGEQAADSTSSSPYGGASSRTVHNLQALLQFGTGPATIRLNCRGGAAWSANDSSIIAIEVQNASASLFP